MQFFTFIFVFMVFMSFSYSVFFLLFFHHFLFIHLFFVLLLFIAFPPGISKDETLMFSSAGAALEYRGNRLGEFEAHGLHAGKPAYRQRDTLGSVDLFLYYSSGHWWVGSVLGSDHGWLWNQHGSQRPSEFGWQYYYLTWKKDPSLRLQPGHLDPCTQVFVTATGRAKTVQGSKLGTYTPTGDWMEGRPVYRQEKGKRYYLIIPEKGTTWAVHDTPKTRAGYIRNTKATNSPGDRAKGMRWEYLDGRPWDGEWREGDITVTCADTAEVETISIYYFDRNGNSHGDTKSVGQYKMMPHWNHNGRQVLGFFPLFCLIISCSH